VKLSSNTTLPSPFTPGVVVVTRERDGGLVYRDEGSLMKIPVEGLHEKGERISPSF